MKYLDFLSSSPSIYLIKEKRGQNKVGGFFSIIFVLAMVGLLLYYFLSYFFGLEYELTYYRTRWMGLFTEDQQWLMRTKSFTLDIPYNPNNAEIIPVLKDMSGHYHRAKKCDINSDNDVYCFNLSFIYFPEKNENENDKLYLLCKENCTYPNGEPAQIQVEINILSLSMDN